MKLTNAELRECAKGGHWCGSENRPAMASELLALRAERKRLRHWLGQIRALTSTDPIVKGWCTQSLTAARKPRKKA